MYTLYATLGRIRRFFNNIHYVNFLSISLIFMFESMNMNEKLHIQLHAIGRHLTENALIKN